jgi:hypothetical protein
MARRTSASVSVNPGNTCSVVYLLALIGTLVYFWQQSNTVTEYIVAIVKAILWPAFLVYDAFQAWN